MAHTMAFYRIELDGLDARITIDRGNSVGYPAYGIAFDEDANIIADFDSRTYGGYCHAEILAVMAHAMFNRHRPVEFEAVTYAVAVAGHECQCED